MQVRTKFQRRLNLELRFQDPRSEHTQNRKPCGDRYGLIQKIWGDQVIVIYKYQKSTIGLLDSTQSREG